MGVGFGLPQDSPAVTFIQPLSGLTSSVLVKRQKKQKFRRSGIPIARDMPDHHEVCAFGTPDEDCDGETNYDTLGDGIHGDNDCAVLINAIIAPAAVENAKEFRVGCNASVSGVNSVELDAPGLSCVWSGEPWDGTTVWFNCTAPAADGTYTAKCYVNTARSYQEGTNKSASILVGACVPGDTMSCGTDVGVCSSGTRVCNASGQWSTVCSGAVGPLESPAEVSCNGLDDDCDGFVDEGCDDDNDTYADDAMVCNVSDDFIDGRGVRRSCATYGGDCDDDPSSDPAACTGSFVCDKDHAACAYCIHPGATEFCDGVDNDCAPTLDGSGVAPESLQKQYGVCAGYNKSCESGAWVDDYSVVPFYEDPEHSCDGRDNDCDNYIDEYYATNSHCYGLPGINCGGLLNCSSRFAYDGVCDVGCRVVEGTCKNADVLFCYRISGNHLWNNN